MNTGPTWAVVPARSGSRGFPDKNIAPLLGTPLLSHSLRFAQKLPFVDRVVLSTDDPVYAAIGREHGADVPFLRGADASADTAMEEHVLEDLRLACARTGETPPAHVIWLRPTHPIRSVQAFEAARALYQQHEDAVCVVVHEDPRVFFADGDHLAPTVPAFQTRSMVRRQDCAPAYRIFGGEIFAFPSSFDPRFLGRARFVVAPDACRFDIDDAVDLARLEAEITHPQRRERYAGLVH